MLRLVKPCHVLLCAAMLLRFSTLFAQDPGPGLGHGVTPMPDVPEKWVGHFKYYDKKSLPICRDADRGDGSNDIGAYCNNVAGQIQSSSLKSWALEHGVTEAQLAEVATAVYLRSCSFGNSIGCYFYGLALKKTGNVDGARLVWLSKPCANDDFCRKDYQKSYADLGQTPPAPPDDARVLFPEPESAHVPGYILQQSLAETKAKAQAGDAASMVALGNRYEYGFGVLKDRAEAVRLYEAAAAQGNLDAMFHLGTINMLVNDTESRKWLVQCAVLNDFNCVMFLAEGYGSRRHSAAVYRRALDIRPDDAKAQTKLAELERLMGQPAYRESNYVLFSPNGVVTGNVESDEIATRNAEAAAVIQREQDAQDAADNARRKSENRAAMLGALSDGLNNMAATMSQPTAIQTARDQQLANIDAAATARPQPVMPRVQQPQTHTMTPAPAAPKPAVVVNTGTVAPPVAYVPPASTGGTVVSAICPASGFVPGLMIQHGDTAQGVQCTPGQPIGSSPPSSNSGPAPSAGSGITTTPALTNCLAQSYVDGDLTVTNTCNVPVYASWWINGHGGSWTLNPGEHTGTGYSSSDVAVGGASYYVCPQNASPADLSGHNLTGPVSSYVCVVRY